MRKTIMAIVAAIVVGFTMSAKAATVPNMTIKVDGLQSGVAVKGSKVTVTVALNDAEDKITSTNFELKYDTSMLSYNDEATQENVKGMLEVNEIKSENKASVGYIHNTGVAEFTMVFDVIGTKGDTSIELVPTVLETSTQGSVEINEKTPTATQKVTVSETKPSTGGSTGNNNNGGNNTGNNNNNNTSNKKPAANTTTTKKKPTKYDQTGVNVLNYVGVVGLVAAAAAGTVVLKKCKNN